ncbi:MAG: hypothetical protein ABIR29_02540, partial [Chthoniobacterales bacterium]
PGACWRHGRDTNGRAMRRKNSARSGRPSALCAARTFDLVDGVGFVMSSSWRRSRAATNTMIGMESSVFWKSLSAPWNG